jgi:2-amino-4-hydroxy-6-hydroxymethyldihydropteridine diphosphokinase
MEHFAAIGLGSNLGDSRALLEGAIARLSRSPGIRIEKTSRLYRTAAIGPPQPDYLNACALLRVKLSPLALLKTLLTIEAEFGRVRSRRWGPRTLDLDLLLYDDVILETPELQLPHPRFRERAFVLVPLAEIAPDRLDPVSGKTIARLRDGIARSGVIDTGLLLEKSD